MALRLLPMLTSRRSAHVARRAQIAATDQDFGKPPLIRGRREGLSSGKRMMLAIALGLLPLGLLGLYSAQQSLRTAAADRLALFNIAGREIANQLSVELAADAASIETAILDPITGQPREGWLDRLCEQTRRYDGSSVRRPRLVVTDAAAGTDACQPGRAVLGAAAVAAGAREADAQTDGGTSRFTLDDERKELRRALPLPDAAYRAILVYPMALLDTMAAPTSALPPHELILETADEQLAFPKGVPAVGVPGLGIAIANPVGETGITARLLAPPFDYDRSVWLTLLVPVLMWVLAAGLSWAMLVWIILRPLQKLHRAVAAYSPGQQFRASHGRYTHEVDDLEDAFVAIAERVAADKDAIDQAMQRQQMLTREVHHRVKNNLQIVASLINLHSRDACEPAAADAYRTIQRRVDALAVVHRNHFASIEAGGGIMLSTLLAELQTTLQVPVTEGAQGPQIRLSVQPVRVSQDVALPIAFLVTELVELAQQSASAPAITVRVARDAEAPGTAFVRVESAAFADPSVHQALADGQHARVLTGLSRQLRQTLDQSPDERSFQIRVSLLDEGA